MDTHNDRLAKKYGSNHSRETAARVAAPGTPDVPQARHALTRLAVYAAEPGSALLGLGQGGRAWTRWNPPVQRQAPRAPLRHRDTLNSI